MRSLALALIFAGSVGHAESAPQDISWDDGDSGRINDVRFRLADVDAPESRSMNSPVGPAKCEAERLAGMAAKQFMIELTSQGRLDFVWNGEIDRRKRKVGDILISGVSVSMEGLLSGHLREWEHDGRRQLMPKPDWCASQTQNTATNR